MPPLRLVLLLLLGLFAAAPVLADAYRIEMVVFQRFDDAAGETWDGEEDRPDMARATASVSSLEVSAGNRLLGPIAYTLDRKGYRVLLHTAWVQAVGGRSSGRWLSVRGNGVEGLVRVTRGRYLHFDTDLVLSSAAEGPIRTRQSRRMRSAEVHYLDHPRLGIVVRIDRYTTGGGAPSEPDAPESETP